MFYLLTANKCGLNQKKTLVFLIFQKNKETWLKPQKTVFFLLFKTNIDFIQPWRQVNCASGNWQLRIIKIIFSHPAFTLENIYLGCTQF
jgi:hypothetical protein